MSEAIVYPVRVLPVNDDGHSALTFKIVDDEGRLLVWVPSGGEHADLIARALNRYETLGGPLLERARAVFLKIDRRGSPDQEVSREAAAWLHDFFALYLPRALESFLPCTDKTCALAFAHVGAHEPGRVIGEVRE